jgi:hypothetical protein
MRSRAFGHFAKTMMADRRGEGVARRAERRDD